MKNRNNWNWLISGVIFLSVILITSSVAFLHIDPHHDGILLKPALDILHGKIAYRQSFNQYGALTAFFQVFLLRLFGPSLFSLRLGTVLCYGVIGVLLYWIWKKIVRTPLALASVAVWIGSAYFFNRTTPVPFLPWSSVYSLLTQCVTLWFLLEWQERRQGYLLFAAGVSVALTFWFRQPVGMLLSVAGGGWLILDWLFLYRHTNVMKNVLLYVAGAFVPSIVFLGYFWSVGALHDWWQQSIYLAFDFGNRLSNRFYLPVVLRTVFPPFFTIKDHLLWVALPMSMLATGLWVCWQYVQKWKLSLHEQQLLLITAISFASWGQYFPVSEYSHWFWAASPMFGLLFWLVYVSSEKFLRWLQTRPQLKHSLETWRMNNFAVVLSCLIVGVMFLPTLRSNVRGFKFLLSRSYHRVEQPSILRGMYIEDSEQQVYDTLLARFTEYFAVYPQKTYVNMSPDALYAALDEAHYQQIDPMHVYWDWVNETLYPDFLPKMRQYISDYRPVIIARTVTDFPDYCAIDYAVKEPIQVTMYQRPLILMVPAEDVIGITKNSSTRYVIESKLDEVMIDQVDVRKENQATQSTQVNRTLQRSQEFGLAVPNAQPFITKNLKFHTPKYGDCTITLQ